MSSNREKTSSVMGFVISILLHGIFFAGCLALDYTQEDTSMIQDATEINQEADQAKTTKSKS